MSEKTLSDFCKSVHSGSVSQTVQQQYSLTHTPDAQMLFYGGGGVDLLNYSAGDDPKLL